MWVEIRDEKINIIVTDFSGEKLAVVIKLFRIFLRLAYVKEKFVCIKYIKVTRVTFIKSIEKK